MRNKTIKKRCTKQSLPKFEGGCKTFDELQAAAAVCLSELEDVENIRSNVDSALVDGTQCTTMEQIADMMESFFEGTLFIEWTENVFVRH